MDAMVWLLPVRVNDWKNGLFVAPKIASRQITYGSALTALPPALIGTLAGSAVPGTAKLALSVLVQPECVASAKVAPLPLPLVIVRPSVIPVAAPPETGAVKLNEEGEMAEIVVGDPPPPPPPPPNRSRRAPEMPANDSSSARETRAILRVTVQPPLRMFIGMT